MSFGLYKTKVETNDFSFSGMRCWLTLHTIFNLPRHATWDSSGIRFWLTSDAIWVHQGFGFGLLGIRFCGYGLLGMRFWLTRDSTAGAGNQWVFKQTFFQRCSQYLFMMQANVLGSRNQKILACIINFLKF